ncbi:MAG: glycosyltransferase family 2 protein [Pseudomonadota bacterium]
MLDAIASSDVPPLYRLQGLDRSLIGGSGLYLASNRPALAANAGPLWTLLPGDWLGGGTFRNSFYAEPWLRFTRVRDLCLQLVLRGSFRLRVMQAAAGTPAIVLKELRIDQTVSGPVLVPVAANLQDIPPGSRLFWHLEALGGGVLHEANWCTRQAPGEAPACGPVLAVLMRTWGRGNDLRALLRGWLDQAAHDAHLRAVLGRIGFWVLDTTEGAERHWPDPGHQGLGLQVWTAPNLGGGGNASHLLHLFLQDAETSGLEPPELLILDDDLAVSLESLARHLALCAYRERDGLVSLPVLMKSRMTTVWEDGGLWGVDRLPPAASPYGPQPVRRLAPQLIRHGLQLDGYEHLDAFGALNQCEYTTFIFLGLPTRCLRRIGLPAAFFLRGDDIEFCLRARALGLPVWTNPNLAAWHEPGHTPAQEYMAILHAVLTNLHYAANPAEDYVRFFEQRLVEHASIDDLHGLALYIQVLQDLLDEGSRLLAGDFEQHYLQQLPRWAHPAQQALGEADRLRLVAERGATGDRRLLPFAYPGYHPHGQGEAREVWLHVASAHSAWPVAPAPAALRLALHRQGLDALHCWLERFDTLRAHWGARLQASGTRDFWQTVHERCAGRTARLHSAEPGPIGANEMPVAASQERGAAGEAATDATIGEVRERLSQEVAHWQALRERAEREQKRRRRPWPWAAWWRRHAAPLRAEAEGVALPTDWDPRQYLALNADVARSGVDPAAHYLKFGRREGRRYRA